jgi:cytoskeletal protein CcmA (bactofilin family)
MFKRDQAVKPTNAQPTTLPAGAPIQQGAISPIPQTTAVTDTVGPLRQTQRSETGMVNIGKSVVIKGELEGSEDLTIEGRIEGTIRLKDHVLTIGPNGRIDAQVFARSVIVVGTVRGNITASEKLDIRDGASVDGDVVSPRVAIAEGAQFHGSVDMKQTSTKGVQQNSAATNTVPKPANGAAPTGEAQPRAAALAH